MLKKKWMFVSIMGSLALVLALAGVWLFGNPTAVSAAENLETVTDVSAQPGLMGEGYLNHGGPGFQLGNWGSKGDIDYTALLADALGITVEELEQAYESAREAAIAQAVDEGLITQEQADRMLVWGGGVGFRGRGRMAGQADTIDEATLLAEALGITTDELQAAREEANEAAIAQAVEEGLITQEQADEMLRRRTLREDYLDRAALLAEALGMTVEELEDAYAEGQTLSDLLEAQGLDAATVRDRLEEAHEAALEQAVADGVLTQDEADEMQFGFGRGGMTPGGLGTPGAGMRGGQGGRRGRGMMPGGPGMPGSPGDCPGFDGQAPGAEDNTDTGFGRRGGFTPPTAGSDL